MEIFLIVVAMAVIITALLKFKPNTKSSENSSGATQEESRSHELSDEEHQRQASLIEKVKLLCQMAEVHVDYLDEEYEFNTLRKRIEMAKELASQIDEEFYNNSALYFIIILTHKVGWKKDTKELLDLISVDLIKEKITKVIGDEYT